MEIDETGNDYQPRSLNDLFVCRCDKPSDSRDAITYESDVCRKSAAAAAVDYTGANDDTGFCGLWNDCGAAWM